MGVGVLDEIKAISAFNKVEVEVEAELGNIEMICWLLRSNTIQQY